MEGTLEEYEKGKQARLEQLMGVMDNGEITEEEFKATIEQEFQETPQPYLGFFIIKPESVAFTLSHNCFYNVLKAEEHLEIGCFLFNNEMKRTEFNRASVNNEYLEYVEGLRDDRLVIRDDSAIILHGEKLPENIVSLLFYM